MVGMSTTVIHPPLPALTPADRCDRCGAQAYIRAVLPDGELLFCAHHGRRFAAKLREVAADIQDETGTLSNPR
jgi:hypothetical protein